MKKLLVTLEDRNDLETYKAYGCDEVIVALLGNTFTALHEFSVDEVISLTLQVHQMGMKINVIMDRLYAQSEIHEAQNIAKDLIGHGVDAIMFADPGLMKMAMDEGLQSHMIYRSITMTTSANDGLFWMEQGCASVAISSLITKDEIIAIAHSLHHASLTVHGYTLMSVSKRKLLSAYVKTAGKDVQIQGNENLFLREDHRQEKMPAYENEHAMLIYTDYVQSSFEEMDAFMEAGVERFIVETAFLPHEAAMDAIKAYRAVLDGADTKMVEQEYAAKYASLPLSDGYYGQKTIK